MPTSKRPARWLYIDASDGASGDMILGALVDLGVPLARIRRALEALPIENWSIRSRRMVRCALALRKVDVRVRGHEHGRGWKALKRIVEQGELPERARRRALAVFRRLIEAEAEVHGQPADQVHLHEAGATDAIVDVVGACIGLEHLGVERIVVSPLTTGFGRVRCAHGVYPIPAPATALLVRGVPVRAGEIEGERLTPTGAALLTTLADEWGPAPLLRPEAVGYGAGDRDFGEVPNALRMIYGQPGVATPTDAGTAEVAVIECTVDDQTPQALAYATERLFAAGALDVFASAVTMKKGRLGQQLSVLGRPESLEKLTSVLLKETSTLGLRFRMERRVELERSVERVQTPYGPLEVKVGRLGGEALKAWPEYDGCAARAARHGVSLWDVQWAALEAYARSRTKRRRR